MGVKHTSSLMPGHPTLSTTLGTFIGLLDSVLVTGYGLVSVTAASASSGDIVFTAPGHVASAGLTVTVTGSTNSAVNGEHIVTATTTGTVTIHVAGVADGAIGGTMSIKISPFGWTKYFSATNKAAYKSASGKYLVVDDSVNFRYATVRGYGSMTDIDTGTDPFPSVSQQSAGLYWFRQGAGAASPSDIQYLIVGDEYGFYINIGCVSGSGPTWFFGDIVSNKPADSAATVLIGARSSSEYQWQCYDVAYCQANDSQTFGYIQKPYSLLSGSAPVAAVHDFMQNTPTYSGCGSFNIGAYPNPSDNGLRLSQVLCCVSADVRGVFPGIWSIPQPAQSIGFCDTVPGAGITSGRTLMAGKCAGIYSTTYNGTVMFDVTGPWR